MKVSNIPKTVIAEELWRFLESKLGPNTIYALEIATEHKNWKSRGFGRVQFETLEAKRSAELLSLEGGFVFRGSSLSVSDTFDDIIVRPVESRNRVDSGVLHAGFLVEDDCMLVLESWEGVKTLVMPERNRVEFWVDKGGEEYKLEVPFDDVLESSACCLGGRKVNALLLKVHFLIMEIGSKVLFFGLFFFFEYSFRTIGFLVMW